MLPDPKWLDALKLPLRVTLAVALAATALFLLSFYRVLDLGPLQTVTRSILIIVAVLAWALSVVSLAELLFAPIREKHRRSLLAERRALRRQEEDEARAQNEATVLKRLDHLSAEEIRYAADCLRRGTPSFYTYCFSPPVSMLQGKLLVWSPGGQHHQDHYPFSFQDFVWRAMLTRKDEFIAKDEEHKRAEEAAKKAERRRGGY